MPLGSSRQCETCGTTSTPIWAKNEGNAVVCHSCSCSRPKEDDSSQNSNGDSNGSSMDGAETANKVLASDKNVNAETASTSEQTNSSSAMKENGSSQNSTSKRTVRNRQAKAKNAGTKVSNKSVISKGKGRRNIFKKSATKTPNAVATPVTSNSVYHNGSYFQVGDIVSMVDVDDGIYYAQIKGLLQDQYCQKSAAITWLLPTLASPSDCFDPATYIIGPEEDIPRKLECMSFVCHAPSDYFKNLSSPYTTISTKQDTSFIWTRMGPQVKSFNNYSYET